ncbi:MAG: GntR family transcriptional regulator [Clostridiales bacterium]|nr:GntR family transcriptional regulator [Clostridiales bacterium]
MNTVTNTKEHLYNTVKAEILDLELKPGVRISEAEVAKRLGVSRQPIRELFIRLTHDKLVQVVPQKGTFISLIDLDYVKQVIYMRFLVEKNILQEACDKLDDADIEKLKDICDSQTAIAEDGGDPIEFLRADNSLHRTIFHMCGHDVIWSIIESNNVNYSRFRLLDVLEKDIMHRIVKQHRKIIELIETKNKSGLKELLEEHLYQGLDNSEHIIDRYKEYFSK